MSADLRGTVLAVQANFYRVRLDGGDWPLPELLCTRRSRLKKIGQQVMVGDRVGISEPDWQGCRGAIDRVEPRRSQLDRPPVANVDQILLVFALAEPTLDPTQLSRFLLKAEAVGVDIRLALNKADLISSEEQQRWSDRLVDWGYQAHFLSLYQDEGIQTLLADLSARTSIVCGPSGVGKSSLINRLIPAIDLRTGAVSGKLGRGRHTTRHVELFELPGGGLLADSPGFNQPDLEGDVQDLALLFPEARQRLVDPGCQFSDCLHREEPGCGVRGGWERYPLYCDLLSELQALNEQQSTRHSRTSTLKRKIGSGGQVEYEPLLASHRYRRDSRRSGRQSLRASDWTTRDPDGEEP